MYHINAVCVRLIVGMLYELQKEEDKKSKQGMEQMEKLTLK